MLGTLNTCHLQIANKTQLGIIDTWTINWPQFPYLWIEASEWVHSFINFIKYLLINISIKSRDYAEGRSSFFLRSLYSTGDWPEAVLKK